jgi:hypothetical protein
VPRENVPLNVDHIHAIHRKGTRLLSSLSAMVSAYEQG